MNVKKIMSIFQSFYVDVSIEGTDFDFTNQFCKKV
ncbi:Uncharacterised protein [Streptococcus pneumoniae]|nr:Uncharacterised protein [Streptococcus pneumoniae]